MESLGRGGDGVPCRGFPRGASPGCRDLRLGARGEEEEDPVGLVATGRGPRLTFLPLSSLFFRWDLGSPFDVLLGVPHSEVPVSSPRASGGVRALPLRVCRGLVHTCPVGNGVCSLRFWWVHASAPAGCSPRGPGGVESLLQGLFSFLRLSEEFLSYLPSPQTQVRVAGVSAMLQEKPSSLRTEREVRQGSP